MFFLIATLESERIWEFKLCQLDGRIHRHPVTGHIVNPAEMTMRGGLCCENGVTATTTTTSTTKATTSAVAAAASSSATTNTTATTTTTTISLAGSGRGGIIDYD